MLIGFGGSSGYRPHVKLREWMKIDRMNTVIRRLPEKYQYLRSAWKSSDPRSTWKKSREGLIIRECLILEAKEK